MMWNHAQLDPSSMVPQDTARNIPGVNINGSCCYGTPRDLNMLLSCLSKSTEIPVTALTGAWTCCSLACKKSTETTITALDGTSTCCSAACKNQKLLSRHSYAAHGFIGKATPRIRKLAASTNVVTGIASIGLPELCRSFMAPRRGGGPGSAGRGVRARG